jgi:hypothetical protein
MSGKTLITIVLDETGSMNGRQDQVISGFNEFLHTQQDKGLGDCQVTLIKFNSEQGINAIFKDKDIQEVKELTHRDYQPTGTTPLYDAIAQGIQDTEEGYKKANEVLAKLLGKETKAAMPFVVMLIMTDGMENASHHYNQKDIFNMVSQRKKDGWSFVFMGADMDAWSASAPIGFASRNTRSYAGAQTASAFQGFTQSLTAHRLAYNAAYTAGNVDEVVNSIKMAATNYWGDSSLEADNRGDSVNKNKFEARKGKSKGGKNAKL